MDEFRIQGPARLQGEVAVSGAKNSALPCLAAALLTEEPVRLANVPLVRDVRTMQRLLQHIGAGTHEEPSGAITVETRRIGSADAPYDLVKTMRASVLVLGPLLARAGSVRVSLPGGCAIGVRPIDLHLEAFRKMGAEVVLEHGYVEASATRLTGAEIPFETVTVTGTENAMLAATLARGTTVPRQRGAGAGGRAISRTSCAPWARASPGTGRRRSPIEGVERLHGAAHEIVPDRIEAGTYAIAGALTRGDVTVLAAGPEQLVGPDDAALPRPASRSSPATDGCACGPPGSSRRTTWRPRRTPASRPTCRRSGWRSRRSLDGRLDGHGDDLREPLPARGRARAHGRADPAGGPLGGRGGSGATDGRPRHGERPAGLRGARAGGPRGRGRDDGRPRLSPRPRLRPHGGEAPRPRRATCDRVDGSSGSAETRRLCLFCRIAARRDPVEGPCTRTTRVYAFEDIAPKAPTHVLVDSEEAHRAAWPSAGSDDAAILGELATRAAAIARERGLSDYRIVINNGEGAGQSVFHLHLHLLGGRPFSWPPG